MVFGPVEAASESEIQRQYEVNVFGLIECVKAIAPHFRANHSGVLINVTSVGGLAASPAYSIYNASKFAVEGLSEGLWDELGTFGIKVKIIEPGVTKTDFSGRSMDVLDISNNREYTGLMEKVNALRTKMVKNPGPSELVAATILRRPTIRATVCAILLEQMPRDCGSFVAGSAPEGRCACYEICSRFTQPVKRWRSNK